MKYRGLEEKAVLVFDNASCHKLLLLSSSDSQIMCILLPPNTASILQPMDQSVFDILKRLYRKSIMDRALSQDMRNTSMMGVLKTISVKDAIMWFAQAWENVSSDILHASWNAILDSSDCKVIEPVASSDIYEGDGSNTDMSAEVDSCFPLEKVTLELNAQGNSTFPIKAAFTLDDILLRLENDPQKTSEEVEVFREVFLRRSA